MDRLRSNQCIHQNSICDGPFSQYTYCLKVIYCLFVLNYIIGMTRILWMNVNRSKKNMTNALILGSETNFLKEAMMILCVQSS